LTAAKELGSFITTPDGTKVPLGIPQAQKDSRGGGAYKDIPLGRPGTATEAASAILAVASPLFSYVDGQVIMVCVPVYALSEPSTNHCRLPGVATCNMNFAGAPDSPKAVLTLVTVESLHLI